MRRVAPLPTSTRLLQGLVSPEYLLCQLRLTVIDGQLTQFSIQIDAPELVQMLVLDALR